MKAAWYEKQGPAPEVLVIGEMPTPEPGEGEVRIRVAASGINPGDVKKRQDTFGVGMPYPRVIPHSDGAGVIDKVGEGISRSRTGERVWCFGAQSYRPFGTAAEYVVVPSSQAIRLPESVSFEQGACLGIPGITAHRAVYIAGSVAGRTVLIQGGAGTVGECAVALASHTGAKVIATVRSERDEAVSQKAGAHHVVRTDNISSQEVIDRILAFAPDGIDHIVEVAFNANIRNDEQLLKMHGTIGAYATGESSPRIPFWPLVFKNISLFFLGSDDFPMEAKETAARDLNKLLDGSWQGYDVEASFPLESIADAHEVLEKRKVAGRVILSI